MLPGGRCGSCDNLIQQTIQGITPSLFFFLPGSSCLYNFISLQFFPLNRAEKTWTWAVLDESPGQARFWLGPCWGQARAEKRHPGLAGPSVRPRVLLSTQQYFDHSGGPAAFGKCVRVGSERPLRKKGATLAAAAGLGAPRDTHTTTELWKWKWKWKWSGGA